jgi:hypothetical protein
MNTISGEPFYLAQPERSKVNVQDIAYGLSNLCRFAGQMIEFYSVAQHCVVVSSLMPTPELMLQGLLHDAVEAYTGDITSPMKALMNGYKEAIEVPIEREIFRQLGVAFPMDPEVKKGDLIALTTEIRDLMNGHLWQPGLPEPMKNRLIAWPPETARMTWLWRYNKLRGAA